MTDNPRERAVNAAIKTNPDILARDIESIVDAAITAFIGGGGEYAELKQRARDQAGLLFKMDSYSEMPSTTKVVQAVLLQMADAIEQLLAKDKRRDEIYEKEGFTAIETIYERAEAAEARVAELEGVLKTDALEWLVHSLSLQADEADRLNLDNSIQNIYAALEKEDD
jgi:hypothetical protein